MADQFTEDDDALLAQLGVDAETRKAASRTPREERIIAGFEEIQRFVDEHGAAPCHGEDRNILTMRATPRRAARPVARGCGMPDAS